MTNAELAKIVCNSIDNSDYQKVLSILDISRPDESESVDVDIVVSNFKQMFE